jgi:predicted hotdog family 3-hydroxylacyl-ACP dehydratase
MLLLDRVLAHTATETTCALRPAESALFADGEGRIPAYLSLEWMAQCIAAHGGLHGHAEGSPPRPGLFLGTRRARLPGRSFPPEGELLVSARWHHGRGVGAHAFACTLRAPGESGSLAEGLLNVLIFESLDALQGPASGAGDPTWR